MLTLFVILQTSVTQLVVQTVLALLVPIAGTWLATAASKLWPAVAQWAEWEKRLLATGYAVVITGVSHALGLTLPEAWGALGSTEFQAMLGAAGAMLVHRIFNPKPATP